MVSTHKEKKNLSVYFKVGLVALVHQTMGSK